MKLVNVNIFKCKILGLCKCNGWYLELYWNDGKEYLYRAIGDVKRHYKLKRDAQKVAKDILKNHREAYEALGDRLK